MLIYKSKLNKDFEREIKMIAMISTLMLMIFIGISIMTFVLKLVYKAFSLAISGMSFGVQVVAKIAFLVPVIIAAIYCTKLLGNGFIA